MPAPSWSAPFRPLAVFAVVASTALLPAATVVDASAAVSPEGTASPGVEALETQPEPLLPDMTPLRAWDLSIQRSGGVRRLRFAAGLANIGRGPMEVRPDHAEKCRGGKRHASQVIYRDLDGNGYFKRDVDTSFAKKSAGCMVFHPQHNHWHFEAASRYRLFRPGAQVNVLVRARKMSFCLRDSERVPERLGVFHKPLHYRECGRDTPQGISTGWVDVYSSYLSGQSLTLPRRLRHGIYCLGIRVDPLDRLWESDETNNDSVKAFRLKRTTIGEVERNDVCSTSASP